MYSASQKNIHFAIPRPKKYNNDVMDLCVGAVSNALTINVNILEREESQPGQNYKIFILQARI